MRRPTTRAALVCAVSIVSTLAIARDASAGTGFEFPDNGPEQLGRGGAWVARASDPLAAYFNPAAIATQRSGLTLSSSFIWQKNCFKRTDPNGNLQHFSTGGAWTYADQVCNSDSGTPFPNPQIAGVYRVNHDLALGLAVIGPSTRGKFDYPLLALDRSGVGRASDGPSPGRYLLASDNLLFFWPQISIGYQVTPKLSLGASLIWGIAKLKFSAISSGGLTTDNLYNNQPVDGFEDDFRADLDVHDWFVPGFTLGALYQASETIDVGAWYQWSDDIKAKGDAVVTGPVYQPSGALESPAQQARTEIGGDRASMVAPWPMQARIGARFHMPRDGAAIDTNVRDPIASDLFDVELDVTWANNSHFKDLSVHFPSGIAVNIPGLQGAATLPPDASIPHHWKDSFGVRLGGDYVVVADKLSVRAGGSFQSEAQDPKYLHLDYVPSQMFGLDAGLTVRFGSLDLLAAYGHVFYKGLDNHGQGATYALCGMADCGGSSPFRTAQTINGGSNSSVLNVVSAGATYRF